MVHLLAMLAQQVHAVVIAIRGPHDRMNVLARWRIIIKCNAALVIELKGRFDDDRRLVLQGRERAQARGELPPDAADPEEDARLVDLIFDVIAGAVVHRTLVSAEPVDAEWACRFTTLILHGLAAASPR